MACLTPRYQRASWWIPVNAGAWAAVILSMLEALAILNYKFIK
jgi:hypothetical protein